MLPARLVLLEGTVGEEQHPVAAPELVLTDDWRGSAEADREGPGAFQRLGNPAAADQQRRRVASVDPLQVPCCDVQAHHLRCDELVGPELLLDDRVHQPVQASEPNVGPPGVAVGADSERREHGSVQAVAHRVYDGEVDNVIVDRVVEAVTSDVIGGLEDPGQRDLRGDHGHRGKQRPLDLGGQAHRRAAPGLEELVGVGALGGQHAAGQDRELPQQPSDILIGSIEGEGQHPCLVAVVHQRQVQSHAVVPLFLDHGHAQEGPAGRGAVDRLGFPRHEPPARQRPEHPLAVVLQQDGHVPAADPGCLLRD